MIIVIKSRDLIYCFLNVCQVKVCMLSFMITHLAHTFKTVFHFSDRGRVLKARYVVVCLLNDFVFSFVLVLLFESLYI